jgi:hypothetical protein
MPPTAPDAPHAKESVKVRVVEATAPQLAQVVASILDATPAAMQPPAVVAATPATRDTEKAPPPPPIDDDAPEIEARSIHPPKKRRAIALTFLDGTTINLPAPRGVRAGRPRPSRESAPPSEPTAIGEDELTARDLVSALRAVSHGVDASEILGDNPRWEKMFAALLSLLLRKHLIADWEFVEEYRRI